jgi:glutamate decarboxylase
VKLLGLVEDQILPWVSAADGPDGGSLVGSNRVLPPNELEPLLHLDLPNLTAGRGEAGLSDAVRKILHHSVNTWSQGFMDKLYATTDPVGVAAELLTAALNTNVHVYQVSPALSVIERETTAAMAGLVGFSGEFRGGMTLPGGSASNAHSMIIAKNTMFPETKEEGNGGRRFAVFTSVHGHYSVEKAAVMCGFGKRAVWNVEVDAQGRMRTDGGLFGCLRGVAWY